MSKSRYGRWHGASDMWDSAVCQRCNRRINLTRRGQFRKHVASKGVECCGSWEFVDIQKERIAIPSRLTKRAADVSTQLSTKI